MRAIEPDIAVVQAPRRGGAGAAAAVAEDVEVCEPVEVPLPTLEELRYTWIEIRKRPDRQLVTVLELLTQMNKSGQGRAEYEAKRRRLWSLSVHLIELDFLLAGPRMPLAGPLPPGDFYAYVTRGDGRSMCQVFAWSFRRRPPTIPLPLLPPDPDVPLDLAAVYATAHQRGRYRERLDYRAALALPLAPEARSWLENQARTAVG